MKARVDLRLGIDVGGTNTDAVLVGVDGRLVAKAKVPTTPDVIDGIVASIGSVLRGAEPSRVTHVMVGTTHATNALVRRVALRRVAVLRIGAPATLGVEPLLMWPRDLKTALCAGWAVVGGGMDLHGRELEPLDTETTTRFFSAQVGRAQAVAITSMFSPISSAQEELAADIARSVLGDVHISLSHEIGTIGLIERENAAVLNAALAGVAQDVAAALMRALETHGLVAEAYFAQNDGTLMALEQAVRYPVLTIACGPANSMRGAAHLSGATDGLVADVGGTTADIGALVSGFPASSSNVVGIGGVRTNFRMPDLVAVPVGGGTIVAKSKAGPVLGPESVGRRLTSAALVFGGATPTLTDAAVAAGRASVGTVRPPASARRALAGALRQSDEVIASAVDRAKLAPGDPPLIVVGGASFLVPDRVPGVGRIQRPAHHEVANAIGAAIAHVGGQVDRIVQYGQNGRQALLDQACDAARDLAIRAGADPARTEIAEIEEVPLTYLKDPVVRLRIRATGPVGGM